LEPFRLIHWLSQNLRETVLDVERNPAVIAAGRDITGMGEAPALVSVGVAGPN